MDFDHSLHHYEIAMCNRIVPFLLYWGFVLRWWTSSCSSKSAFPCTAYTSHWFKGGETRVALKCTESLCPNRCLKWRYEFFIAILYRLGYTISRSCSMSSTKCNYISFTTPEHSSLRLSPVYRSPLLSSSNASYCSLVRLY